MAINICVYGVLETILTNTLSKAASLIGHIIVPIICMFRGSTLRTKWVLIHSIILGMICLIYAFLDKWPYVISIPQSFLFMIPLQIVLLTHSY